MPNREPISVVVPAYNEENAVADVLKELVRTLRDSGLTYEIILVDDGSKDATAQRAGQVDGVRIVRHKVNKGYGAALKTGIRKASHDWICITDADGTYPNEEIPRLHRAAVEQEYDMVVGARTGEQVHIPFMRRPAKWAIRQLCSFVAGQKIPDFNSGLRVFRRHIATRMFNLLPDGFSFTTTITLAMLTNAFSVQYIPINYMHRVGKSKIRPIHDTLQFSQLALRICLYFVPLRIFLPLAGILFVLAVAWGFFSKYVLGQLADVSVIIMMMTSFQVAVMGLLAELINRRLPSAFDGE